MSRHHRHGTNYTAAEDAWLREHYANTSNEELARHLDRTVNAIMQRAKRRGLEKTPEFLASTARRNLGSHGRRFQPGMVPWNKGLSYRLTGRAMKNQFQPGNLPHNHKPVGHERINAEGYLERKITDHRGAERGRSNYRAVHLLLWERHHGPIPAGHIIVFRNGDKRDIRLDNLECISRHDNMLRNSVHHLPEEIRGAIRAKARLTRVINQMGEK